MSPSKGAFADIPPITDFESCQRVRPMLMHRVGDILGVWRDCAHRSCRRAKSCRGGDGACLFAFMHRQPDEDRRLFQYALKNRMAGLDPDAAMDAAKARVAAEVAQYGWSDAALAPKNAHEKGNPLSISHPRDELPDPEAG